MFDHSLRTSALTPAGPVAQSIDQMYWFMVLVFGLVFIATIFLLFVAIFKKPKGERPKPPMGDTWFIASLGLILPGFILAFLLIYTMVVTASLEVEESALTIDITGHMWWWEVEYKNHGIKTANEIYIPTDTAIRFRLHSKDVIHSFWIPSLAGKTDLIPGVTNTQWLIAEKPGVYRGQCAEFCGLQHARMSFYLVAVSPEEFEKWISEKGKAPTLSDNPLAKRGQKVFFEVGCDQCHSIQGTAANSNIGPDLTLLSSRLSLGAGLIRNNKGNLAGWIANPQDLKPGNYMPATYIAPEDFEALLEYLMSLN